MTEYGRAFVCDTQLTEEDVTPMLLDNFARECISTPALAGHTPQIRSSVVWPVYEDYIEDEYGDMRGVGDIVGYTKQWAWYVNTDDPLPPG